MEANIQKMLLLVALFTAGILVYTSYSYLHEQVIVDRCLSANHGSFDYSKMSCDLETNHPYVPYLARHPHAKQVFLLALIVLATSFTAHSCRKLSRRM